MVNSKRSFGSGLKRGGLFAFLLCAAFAARAQESGGNTIIGPPQLKDFSLEPRQRIVTQPAPPPRQQQPVEIAPPPPRAQSRAERPAREAPAVAPSGQGREAQAATQLSRPPAAARPEAVPGEGAQAPIPATPFIDLSEAPAEPSDAPAAEPVAGEAEGWSLWFYALPAAALALLGVALVRRRRRNGAAVPIADPLPVEAAPPKPRPDPIPRPWLEIALKAERAAFTDAEAVVEFELEIANKGGSPARNLRIDVKMFNAGVEQDKEIGAFFRTAGRETTRLSLPRVDAGVTGYIRGSVGLPREQIRAMKLDERLLFIPVVAVNTLYDWGEDRTGQTSRSYIVGREAQAPSEKMGPFRVDQGPRVWRTVGQRPHKLTKRV